MEQELLTLAEHLNVYLPWCPCCWCRSITCLQVSSSVLLCPLQFLR